MIPDFKFRSNVIHGGLIFKNCHCMGCAQMTLAASMVIMRAAVYYHKNIDLCSYQLYPSTDYKQCIHFVLSCSIREIVHQMRSLMHLCSTLLLYFPPIQK